MRCNRIFYTAKVQLLCFDVFFLFYSIIAGSHNLTRTCHRVDPKVPKQTRVVIHRVRVAPSRMNLAGPVQLLQLRELGLPSEEVFPYIPTGIP